MALRILQVESSIPKTPTPASSTCRTWRVVRAAYVQCMRGVLVARVCGVLHMQRLECKQHRGVVARLTAAWRRPRQTLGLVEVHLLLHRARDVVRLQPLVAVVDAQLLEGVDR